jgi:CRISPR/Cas system Type II protein with McrA/HNH and RuvC-like nuclease domain
MQRAKIKNATFLNKYLEQKGKCAYCYKNLKTINITIDHIIPFCKI